MVIDITSRVPEVLCDAASGSLEVHYRRKSVTSEYLEGLVGLQSVQNQGGVWTLHVRPALLDLENQIDRWIFNRDTEFDLIDASLLGTCCFDG